VKRDYCFYVYIVASYSGTLYVGFSNDLWDRVCKHKVGYYDGFSKKYDCHKLVYYEEDQYVLNAIAREKQIKKWNRKKKEALIRTQNPSWKDLAADWYTDKTTKIKN
jgi:putative endonuclease